MFEYFIRLVYMDDYVIFVKCQRLK